MNWLSDHAVAVTLYLVYWILFFVLFWYISPRAIYRKLKRCLHKFILPW